MKTKLIYIIGFLGLLAFESHAQSKTTTANIKVFGNCIMCKNRIETVLDHPGIKYAEWNSETKMLEVAYNNRKISEKNIHELIASTGHDTDSVKARNEVYAKLPFCCLYRDHDHSNVKEEPHNH